MASLLRFGLVAVVLLVVQAQASPMSRADEADRITQGLSGVLQGVRGGNLEQILRGSFDFTEGGRTRQVANSVIDAVFNRNGNGATGSGSSGSSSSNLRAAVSDIDRLA